MYLYVCVVDWNSCYLNIGVRYSRVSTMEDLQYILITFHPRKKVTTILMKLIHEKHRLRFINLAFSLLKVLTYVNYHVHFFIHINGTLKIPH